LSTGHLALNLVHVREELGDVTWEARTHNATTKSAAASADPTAALAKSSAASAVRCSLAIDSVMCCPEIKSKEHKFHSKMCRLILQLLTLAKYSAAQRRAFLCDQNFRYASPKVYRRSKARKAEMEYDFEAPDGNWGKLFTTVSAI
jgi:hypothetical protein